MMKSTTTKTSQMNEMGYRYSCVGMIFLNRKTKKRVIAKKTMNSYLELPFHRELIVVPCSTYHAARIASGEIHDGCALFSFLTRAS
jgi:hypothetical protein